ncbi:hypothetical protein KY308_03495 [Candidatus Woesearchaeota archaeon]|nr:hypothetical protein [Candidatus Woesearchaeota archaeon]
MIITINTKEDSREEIKRAIQMLMRLIDDSAVTNSQDFAPPATEGMFNIFNDTSSYSAPSEDKKEDENPDRLEIYDY